MIAEKHSAPQKSMWAFTPPLPLNTSPYFHFPSKIVDWVGWLMRSWLPLTERLVFFALAWGSWVWLTPQLEAGAPLSLSWISIVWAKNLGLMVTLAGGLHLYLYRWGRQGKALKFDTSMSNKDSRRFTFGNQVYDNMFWTLVRGDDLDRV